MIITYKGGEIIVESTSTIVAGDLHIPQHSWDMIESVCSEKCKGLILNGDTFNLDSMSEYQRKQAGSDFKTEKACSRMVFSRLLQDFEQIILIEGNHDKRINKMTNYLMTMKELVDLTVPGKDKDRITITDRDYIYLLDGQRKWRICHPREYSRKPGSKAKQMGEKYGCSTILGHSHIGSCLEQHCGFKTHYYIDGFCMLDYDKVEYETMNSSTFTNWANGYIRLVDGNVMIVNDDPIKWEDVKYKVNATGKWGYEQVLWERTR